MHSEINVTFQKTPPEFFNETKELVVDIARGFDVKEDNIANQ